MIHFLLIYCNFSSILTSINKIISNNFTLFHTFLFISLTQHFYFERNFILAYEKSSLSWIYRTKTKCFVYLCTLIKRFPTIITYRYIEQYLCEIIYYLIQNQKYFLFSTSSSVENQN